MRKKAVLSLILILIIYLNSQGANGESGEQGDGHSLSIDNEWSIEWTASEADLINNAPTLVLAVDPDWFPFEALDENDQHYGIGADLLKLIEERSGLTFEIQPTNTWSGSVSLTKLGLVDGLSMVNITPEREHWLVFSETYYYEPNVIVTRPEHQYVTDLKVVEEIIAMPAAYGLKELIETTYPNLIMLEVANQTEAFKAVINGAADLTVTSLNLVDVTLETFNPTSLKISGEMPEALSNNLRIGLRKDKAEYIPIINKAIGTLTASEVHNIAKKHTSLEIVEKGLDVRVFLAVTLTLGIIVFLIILWNFKLRQYNRQMELLTRQLNQQKDDYLLIAKQLEISNHKLKEQTIKDPLTGAYNRYFLEREISNLIYECERYKIPLSMMLLDLDYFKAINDKYGHEKGDEVLKAFSEVILGNIRMNDILVRWGGEEFVIILKHTELDQAQTVAEKMRKVIEETIIPNIQNVTVSIGVSQYTLGEGYQPWFVRTDAAMYQAKNLGRNQVVVDNQPWQQFHMAVTWNDKWLSNNEAIDQEHRKLLEMGNELIAAVANEAKDSAEAILEHLIQHTVYHFNHEEAILREIGFPGLEEHKIIHELLIEESMKLKRSLKEGSISLGNVVEFVVSKVLMGHMLQEDFKYFKYTRVEKTL